MEIKSPPKRRTEEVTEVEWMTDGGIKDSLTLREGDSLKVTPKEITVTFQKLKGSVIIARSKLVYYGVGQRTIEWPAEEPSQS